MPFSRWHFQTNFLEWKCSNFAKYYTECCSIDFNWLEVRIGWDNGLAPSRRQAIIWTNDALVYRHIYVSLGLNELIWPKLNISDVAHSSYYIPPKTYKTENENCFQFVSFISVYNTSFCLCSFEGKPLIQTSLHIYIYMYTCIWLMYLT